MDIPWAGRARPAHVRRVFDSTNIPGHAGHEKGLHRQSGVGISVSSQDQRIAVSPFMNRSSTACQPDIVFLARLKLDFLCSCFREDIQDSCLRCPGGKQNLALLGEPSCRCPAPCHPAPPRSAARTSHGRYFDSPAGYAIFTFDGTNVLTKTSWTSFRNGGHTSGSTDRPTKYYFSFRPQISNLSNPKPGHTTGG